MTQISAIVITVHGIRTFGQWQVRLKSLIAKSNPTVDIKNYGYGYFSVIAFLIPVLRWLAVRAFRRRLREVVAAHPGVPVSIVAHSFGTHIVSWALRRMHPDELPDMPALILAGSVLKSDFDFGPLLRTGKLKRVINECGIDDSVLLLSQCFVLLTGMAGRVGFYGFVDNQVTNRFFRGGHSLYFQPADPDLDSFMRRWWVPVLAHGSAEDDPDERITIGPLRGIGYALMRLADPLKISGYLLLASMLVFYGYLQPRREAQLERDRRQYQAAAVQVTSDRQVPDAVSALARLVSAGSLPPAEHARAVDLVRFGVQKLIKRDQALAEMEPGRLFRSGSGIFLKGSRVTRVKLEMPLAQFFHSERHVTIVVSLGGTPEGEGTTKKTEVVVYDTESNSEIVRNDDLDVGGKKLDLDFKGYVIAGQPGRIVLRLVVSSIEGEGGGGIYFFAIDLDAKTAFMFSGERLLVHRNCSDVAWLDEDDKETMEFSTLNSLFTKDLVRVRGARQEAVVAEYSTFEQLANCTTSLTATGIPALYFPRTFDDSTFFTTTLASAPEKRGEISTACPLESSKPRGASVIYDTAKLDMTQLSWAPDADSGLDTEWLKAEFEGAECLIKLQGPRGLNYIVTLKALGQYIGGWIVCRLRDERSIEACHVYSFASEGGEHLWHAPGNRFLVIGDAITETNSTGFSIVDLADGRSSRPDVSPNRRIRSGAVDDERELLAVAYDIEGWPGATEIFAYDISGNRPRLIGRRRFDSPTAPTIALASEEMADSLAPKLDLIDRGIILLLPQTLIGLDLLAPPWWQRWLSRLWDFEKNPPGEQAILVRWVLPFPAERAPATAARVDGGVLAVFSGSRMRLILAADGTALIPVMEFSNLRPDCRGEILSVTVESDDSVSIQLDGCRIKRNAPPSRGEMPAAAANLDQFVKQLD